VAITGLLINFNTCLSAALPTGALDTLTLAFNVTSKQEKALPVAVFLVGYIFGPLIFGPMSESFGRRICFLSSFGLYTLSTLACALAPNWSALLVFRFLVGIGASAPQYILGGLYSDIYPNLLHRGRAMMLAGLMNSFGPLIGPIIAGYTSITNWHWMFWIALILAGSNWPMLMFLPGKSSCQQISDDN
jgi:MFS family permease